MTGLEGTSAKVMSNPDQYLVFDSPYASDPTHSFLSKDHFGLLLNEPAGWVAQVVLKHTVAIIVECWNDHGRDVRTEGERICEIFHHPAWARSEVQGNMMRKVQEWVQGNQGMLERLSKDSVRSGKNTRRYHKLFV